MKTKKTKLNGTRMTAEQHKQGIARISIMLGEFINTEAGKLYDKLTLDEKRSFEGPSPELTPWPRNELAFGRILCAAVLHRLERECAAESLLADIRAAKRIERR